MSRWLKALATVGLVELNEKEQSEAQARAAARDKRAQAAPPDEDALERELRETRERLGHAASLAESVAEEPSPPPPPEPTSAAAPPPLPSDAAPPVGDASQASGRLLQDIYAEARIAASPYPAEKMLRVLDGLRAMEPAVRKAAILAMDSADDAWTIEDVLLDATRKTKALQGAILAVQQAGAQRAEAAQQALTEQDNYLEQATASIRQQISELEVLLQEETRKVTEEKARIQGQLGAEVQAGAHQIARYTQEVARLGELPGTFGE